MTRVEITERAKNVSEKAKELCKNPMVPSGARILLLEMGGLMVDMANRIEILTPFLDEVEE